MTDSRTAASDGVSDQYATTVADMSHKWYMAAAIKSRRAYRVSEVSAIGIAAAIPVSVLLAPGNGIPAAILGALSAIIASLRPVFHWNENYTRFSRAREFVEAERRLYITQSPPYNDDQTRAGLLVRAVTQIEQSEMGQWLNIMRRPEEANQPPSDSAQPSQPE